MSLALDRAPTTLAGQAQAAAAVIGADAPASAGANLRVLALVTDAFGGYGGIAQYNRDFLSARVGCYQYHPTYSFNLVTACLTR